MARVIATVGGLGYAPVAPGTVARLLVALLVWILEPTAAGLVGATLVVTMIGIWAAGREEAYLALHDPAGLVVDEAAGMLVTLVALPRGVGGVLADGYGVVVDDLVVAAYASPVLQVVRGLVPHL